VLLMMRLLLLLTIIVMLLLLIIIVMLLLLPPAADDDEGAGAVEACDDACGSSGGAVWRETCVGPWERCSSLQFPPPAAVCLWHVLHEPKSMCCAIQAPRPPPSHLNISC